MDTLPATGCGYSRVNTGAFHTALGRRCKTVYTALKEKLSDYTPEKTAGICWLDKEDIAKTAKLYAKNKPSAIHWGVAINHIHGDPPSHKMGWGICIGPGVLDTRPDE